jgi:hypothetical protein
VTTLDSALKTYLRAVEQHDKAVADLQKASEGLIKALGVDSARLTDLVAVADNLADQSVSQL